MNENGLSALVVAGTLLFVPFTATGRDRPDPHIGVNAADLQALFAQPGQRPTATVCAAWSPIWGKELSAVVQALGKRLGWRRPIAGTGEIAPTEERAVTPLHVGIALTVSGAELIGRPHIGTVLGPDIADLPGAFSDIIRGATPPSWRIWLATQAPEVGEHIAATVDALQAARS